MLQKTNKKIKPKSAYLMFRKKIPLYLVVAYWENEKTVKEFYTSTELANFKKAMSRFKNAKLTVFDIKLDHKASYKQVGRIMPKKAL